MMLATLAAVHDAREAVSFGNPFTDFGLLLQELRKILEGKDADRAAVAQAKGIMEANKSGSYKRYGHMLQDQFYPLFDKLAALHKSKPSRHPPAPKRFNRHALRHFAVSCWIEQKLQPKTVQTYVGHATLQMTMDTYGHMAPSDDHAKAMDAIARELFS